MLTMTRVKTVACITTLLVFGGMIVVGVQGQDPAPAPQGLGSGYPPITSELPSIGHGMDPEIARLQSVEEDLARQTAPLLAQYAESESANLREKVRTELRNILSKQFDLQRQRRERELARVEERLRKLREQLQKRNDARDSIVNRRLEQLISDAEGMGWFPPLDGAPSAGHGVRSSAPSAFGTLQTK